MDPEESAELRPQARLPVRLIARMDPDDAVDVHEQLRGRAQNSCRD
jgi:hypothetical protein